MKYYIVSKGDVESDEICNHMNSSLKEAGMTEDMSKPDLVISVGGDGTLLDAFHRFKSLSRTTAFVGLHTGHLGFYADWQPHEVDELIAGIIHKNYQVIEYPLLSIETHLNNGDILTDIALNESTLKTSDGSTLVVDVALKGNHFERFRGDGLCISTPSGSTAYNKSLNGALVHPSINAIQVTEIASINNRVFRTVGSPLILPDHHYVRVTPVKQQSYIVTVDHRHHLSTDIKHIQYKVSENRIRFARIKSFPFWQRVHNSFISENN